MLLDKHYKQGRGFIRRLGSSKEKVRRGLHPESFVGVCDICSRLKSTHDNRATLEQYGRFMAHPACYARNRHLESLHQTPLDYAVVRRNPGDKTTVLVGRMTEYLDNERVWAWKILNELYHAEEDRGPCAPNRMGTRIRD